MTSLQEICYRKLANDIQSSPPLIQTMILGKTLNQIKEQHTIELEEKILLNISAILSHLVPEIMQDIVRTYVTTQLRTDFNKKYSHLPVHIIQCAITISERSVQLLEDRYIYNHFLQRDWRRDSSDEKNY